MTRKATIMVLVLALVQFTNIVDFMIIMPLGPILKQLWGINSTQFSWIVSVFSLGSFISSFSSISFIDRYDRKHLLLLSYSGFTVGTFLCGLSDGFHTLLAARFLTGLFGGIGGTVILSMVGDLVEPEHRGKAMGLLMTGFSLASIVGVPGGLWLAGHYAWNTPFLILGSLCLFVLIGIVIILPNFTAHLENLGLKKATWTIINELFSDKNKRWAYFIGGMMMFSHFTIIPFMTDYVTYNLGFDFKSTIPKVYIIGGLLSVFTSPMIGVISDRYGRYKVMVILSVLAMIPILGITNLHTDNIWVLLAVCSTLFIFSGSRFILTSAQVTGASSQQDRGSFLIVNSSIQQLCAALCSVIGGFVIENDEAKRVLNYPILGLIAFGCSILLVVFFRKVKQVG